MKYVHEFKKEKIELDTEKSGIIDRLKLKHRSKGKHLTMLHIFLKYMAERLGEEIDYRDIPKQKIWGATLDGFVCKKGEAAITQVQDERYLLGIRRFEGFARISGHGVYGASSLTLVEPPHGNPNMDSMKRFILETGSCMKDTKRF